MDNQNENPGTDPITDYPEYENDDTDNVPEGVEGGNSPSDSIDDYGDGPIWTTEPQREQAEKVVETVEGTTEKVTETVNNVTPDGVDLGGLATWLKVGVVGILFAVGLWLVRPFIQVLAGVTE